MRTIDSLADLAEFVSRWSGEEQLYVRWTEDMDRDLRTGISRDELTGIELPGLSANSLQVESWWDDRPLTTWLARRLYDYRHLPDKRGPGTSPWVVAGVETGRGPDNEPLVARCRAVARVGACVLDEVQREVERLGERLDESWGSLDRR